MLAQGSLPERICVLLDFDAPLRRQRYQEVNAHRAPDLDRVSHWTCRPTNGGGTFCSLWPDGGASGRLTRLRTIPAVGEKTANRMAAILTSNYFESAKEVAAFLGLVPVQRESGTSVRGRSRLSKAGNPRVRASLYMAAVVAKKINPDIKALYDRLCAQGKTKMSALGACMRKLVHICYGVMKSGHDYEFPTPKSA